MGQCSMTNLSHWTMITILMSSGSSMHQAQWGRNNVEQSNLYQDSIPGALWIHGAEEAQWQAQGWVSHATRKPLIIWVFYKAAQPYLSLWNKLMICSFLKHRGLVTHVVPRILVIIDSGNQGLSPGCMKPLPEPMLTQDHRHIYV